MTHSMRPQDTRYRVVLGFAMGTLALTPFTARPAQADAAPTTVVAPAGDGEELQEIVVSAQKQEMSLQKAPDALTAISALTLQQANVVTPLDLNGQVPSLVISTSEGYNRSVAIRGIGFNVPQTDSAQPSVSYHQDGVYIANPVALNSGFLDVNRIEVLRGPQGTVFGQNALGGTINVISNQPEFDRVKGDVSLSYGSYDLVHTTGALNLPLSDTFALRGAFDQVYQHGWVTATQVPGTNGDYPLNNQNNYHARLLALWKPAETFSIELNAEYAKANQHEVQGKNITDPDPDPYRETSDWPGQFTYEQKIAGGTLNFDLGPATLKVLGSWQAVDQGISVNEDGLDLALASPNHNVQWFYHDSRAQIAEIDLTSKPGGAVDWIVGAFYLHSLYHVAYDQYFTQIGNDYHPDLLNVTNPPPEAIAQIVGGEFVFQSFGLETRSSASGYGQLTWHVTPKLRAVAGLRWTHDYNSTHFSDFYQLFSPAEFVNQTAIRTTWRTSIDYDLTDNNLVYGSVATGFKPGGGNLSSAPTNIPFEYQPETNTAYEIGSKNSFFDKRLTLNAAGFYYVDRNMQYQGEDLINFQGGVSNIPDTHIYGLELESSALLPWSLRADANATVEQGRVVSHFLALDNVAGEAANQQFINSYGYDAYYACVFTGCPALNALRQTGFRDVQGNPPPMLPTVTAAFNLTHTLSLGNGGSLLSRVGVQYRSDYADAIFGKSPIYTAPGYTLVNLYCDYLSAAGNWDLSLSVNNVADRAAVTTRFTDQYGGETTQQYAPPRMFIGRIAYRF